MAGEDHTSAPSARGSNSSRFATKQADLTFNLTVQSHGPHRAHMNVSEGETSKGIEGGSPYFTTVRALDATGQEVFTIPLKEAHFQLEIPAAMLKGNPEELLIRWIDFFRS